MISLGLGKGFPCPVERLSQLRGLLGRVWDLRASQRLLGRSRAHNIQRNILKFLKINFKVKFGHRQRSCNCCKWVIYLRGRKFSLDFGIKDSFVVFDTPFWSVVWSVV